ncbi:hypothetical protein C5167_036910 [Papaver somniferum]|uniref:Uncharacterized protein n=1 Tax=Papaver somniferum TaxID=3469 RepID=A0A4Y7I5B2_PAPSO|nr:hypothetical protein C5167_036910 [Papaver somniferum]
MIRENGEFIIESVDGVTSWLIWIHFLVMLLLMIILFYFTIISVSDKSTSSSSPPPSSLLGQNQISANKKYNHSISTNGSSQVIKVCRQDYRNDCRFLGDDIQRHVNEGHTENQSTSRRGIIRPQVNEVEAFTPPPATTTSTAYCSSSSYNPCYLLELGRRAFLKCLGLDDSSTTSQESSQHNGNNSQEKLTKRDKSQ